MENKIEFNVILSDEPGKAFLEYISPVGGVKFGFKYDDIDEIDYDAIVFLADALKIMAEMQRERQREEKSKASVEEED